MTEKANEHLHQARESIEALLNDTRLPAAAREKLGEEYRQLQRLLDKLEKGHVYVAVFGRVSVGKSALLNALAGKDVFATSVLHGKTQHSEQTLWQEYNSGGVYLIDTPGIDEVDGEERARLARDVAAQSDVILFVVDGDMTRPEYQALIELQDPHRPMLLVLNKADRLSDDECAQLLRHLRRKAGGIVPKERVLSASALPTGYYQVETLANGQEKEIFIRPEPDIELLKTVLWELLKKDGKSYAALSASVFAGAVSEKVGQEIVNARQQLAEKIISQYALIKAVGVALNPVPIFDLFALAADVSMIVHLSSVYGIGFSKAEARELLKTIATQTSVLMGTVFGINLLSSTLKLSTFGISTLFTASAQGGVAYYGSYAIGKAAEAYFAQGASWGDKGAKETINTILHDLNKESVLQEAKNSINDYLGKKE